MTRTRSVAVWVLQVLSILASAHRAGAEPAAPAKDRHVVLFCIDGLPGWAFDDPRLPMPTLLRLGREGAIAKRMTTVNPSMTWPAHATISTGVIPAKHGVLFNGLLLRDGPRLPVHVQQRSREELLRVPTVYDLASRAGLTTAHVNWIPHQVGGTFTWAFPERPKPDGALEREMDEAGVLPRKDIAEFMQSTIVWRDESWSKAAAYLLRRRRPHLLLVHLLALDAAFHRHGPKTVAAAASEALADARLREFLAALAESGIRERTTLPVLSDHGFKPVRRIIRPNVVLREQGLFKAEGAKVAACDAIAVPEGGSAMLFVTDPDRREALVPKLKEAFAALEGVSRVLGPADYAALGYPAPAENAQMADLLLVAKDGYGFMGDLAAEAVSDAREGSTYVGLHGYPADDPAMDAFLIAWGRGIRPGARLDRVRLVDVAPTVAALLGFRMEGVDGRVLDEILE
jgi:predicted AlkP superfamily pyrophosphatase or phosphodiesterase